MRSTLVLMMLLVACNSGKSDTVGGETTDTGGTGDDVNLDDADDVEDLCNEQEPETLTFLIEFEALDGGCPFGEGDNLDDAQGVMTARIEQTESLSLPSSAVICDVTFDFQGVSGGEGTPMVYDDNFLFTFNDVVLAASYGPLVEDLPTSDGLFYEYDWSAVRGYEISFDDSIPTYCLGEADGLADCTIPPPETNGIMSLAFDGDVVNQLSLTAVRQDRYDFTFITLGDNDGTDCSHEEFAFEVEVPYVEL